MVTVTWVQTLDKTAILIALILLGNVWIQLFSLKQYINSRTDWVLQPWYGNHSRRWTNSKLKLVKICLKIDLLLHSACMEELVNIYINNWKEFFLSIYWGQRTVWSRTTNFSMYTYRRKRQFLTNFSYKENWVSHCEGSLTIISLKPCCCNAPLSYKI